MTSDIDFMVDLKRVSGLVPFAQYFDFAEALRDTLGRPVDLVEAGSVRNPYFRDAIERSRELVYES